MTEALGFVVGLVQNRFYGGFCIDAPLHIAAQRKIAAYQQQYDDNLGFCLGSRMNFYIGQCAERSSFEFRLPNNRMKTEVGVRGFFYFFRGFFIFFGNFVDFLFFFIFLGVRGFFYFFW